MAQFFRSLSWSNRTIVLAAGWALLVPVLYSLRGQAAKTALVVLAAAMVMFGPAWIVDGFRIKAKVNNMVGYFIAMVVLTIAAVAIAAAWAYVLGT